MKAGKEKLKDSGSGNLSKLAAAFAAGAATGLAVGMYISSDKGAHLRDKVKNMVKGFTGGPEEEQA